MRSLTRMKWTLPVPALKPYTEPRPLTPLGPTHYAVPILTAAQILRGVTLNGRPL